MMETLWWSQLTCLRAFVSKLSIWVPTSLCVFLYLYGKVYVLIVTPLGCRCMEQPSSSTSLTRRRTCQTVSAHSWACPAQVWDPTGPGVFTATRASVSSPTGRSSSPSEASSLSSTDTPSPDLTPCLLRSQHFVIYRFIPFLL